MSKYVAVLPLIKCPELIEFSESLVERLQKYGVQATVDAKDSVGRRIHRHNHCIIVDFETLENGTVVSNGKRIGIASFIKEIMKEG